MKYIFFLIVIFFSIIFIFHLLTKKYVSPYTFTVIFGKKGAGKSCSMQKDLKKHYKRGWKCYADSNTDLTYVTRIDAKRIFSYPFPPNSLICIDEVNLLWDNRDFKSFDPKVQKWFREQRKHKCKVIAYSQTFDCDKKLRDLADKLAIQTKLLRVWSKRRYYVKTPRVISAQDARDTSKIVDDYVKVPILFGGLDITYIPKYIRCYNTDEIHGEHKRQPSSSASASDLLAQISGKLPSEPAKAKSE